MSETLERKGSRSINVQGNQSDSILITGDRNVVNYQLNKVSLPEPGSVDIRADIADLHSILGNLQSEQMSKITNAIADIEDELERTQPDKDEVGLALDRALQYAKKAEGFTESISELAPCVTRISSWLGENWYKLPGIVGLTV